MDVHVFSHPRLSKLARGLSAAVGVVLLLSALLKAYDATAFADALVAYRVPFLPYGAPLIIMLEAYLGMACLLSMRQRLTAVLGIGFLMVAFGIYAFAYMRHPIPDCGCFGRFHLWEDTPWRVLGRNILLTFCLLPAACIREVSEPTDRKIGIYLAIALSLIAFMTGFSFRQAKVLRRDNVAFQPIAITDHPLSKYLSLQRNQRGLVYCFSYSCPHCINSLRNVEAYHQYHILDSVVGIAMDDSLAQSAFTSRFPLSIPILLLPKKEIAQMAISLPTAFWVEGDTICAVTTGLVPHPAVNGPLTKDRR